MRFTRVEQIPELMQHWPPNESGAPKIDDDFARRDSERLAKWWLTLNPEGFTPSIDSLKTDKGIGWHFWFELEHPNAAKPFRCFRILVQHWKPPRVYQLQFPLEIREFPANKQLRTSFEDLIERSEKRAIESNLRDNVENKSIKSISLYRPFSDKQFDRFAALITQFIDEMRIILNRPTTEGV